MTGAAFPRYTPVADHAVLVAFGDTITEAAHSAVLSLDAALAETPFSGITETVPAYVNLLVGFDPRVTDHAAVIAHLRGLRLRDVPRKGAERVVDICYDGPFAPDLAEVAARCGLSAEEVIAAHLSGEYRVYLYGFAPGYAYLAGTPAAIRLDRKPAPRRGVAAGSVIIAGPQCIVTTLTMPTGWWVIGRSPTAILTGNDARPFLFDVGDSLRFRRVAASAIRGPS